MRRLLVHKLAPGQEGHLPGAAEGEAIPRCGHRVAARRLGQDEHTRDEMKGDSDRIFDPFWWTFTVGYASFFILICAYTGYRTAQ